MRYKGERNRKSEVISAELTKGDDVLFGECLFRPEVVAVLSIAEVSEEPREVERQVAADRSTEPFTKDLLGYHKPNVVLRLMISRAV